MTTFSQSASSQLATGRNADSTTLIRGRTYGGGDGQWSAIAAGAITGLAAGVLMAALGAALGLTATAAVADTAADQATTAQGLEEAAVGFSFGAGIWLVLTAAVVGLVGGTVLVKMSNLSRAYSPGAHGFLTWSLGIAVAALFAVSGSMAISTALCMGGAVAAGGAVSSRGSFRSTASGATDNQDPAGSTEAREAVASGTSTGSDRSAGTADASSGRRTTAMTPAQRDAAIQAAEVAATAAATAASFALISLLVGLGATVGAASRRKYQADSTVGLAQPA